MSSYSTANDYDYLKNSQDWTERIRVRLQMLFRAFKPLNEGSTIEDPRSYETYIQNILNGLNDLLTDYENPYKKKNIRSNLVGRGALYTYLIDKDLPTDLNAEHKKEIEAVFFATFIRLLLLEYYEQHPELVLEYKRERENFKVKLQSSYPDSVPDADDSAELIYLYRFERAVQKLFEVTHKIEIKLSLKVGNLLEGCPDNKRYIIGGRSAKDTMRRLTLIEQMIIINLPDANFAKKKKEKRSLAEMSTTISPSEIHSYVSSSARPPGGEEAAAVTMIGLKYTDVATAGGGVASNSSANTSSNSNGDTKVLGDVSDLFHQVEFNPTALFKAFELLNENYQTSIEQDYDDELDSLYEELPSTHSMKEKEEEEVDQSTLAVLPIKFIQPKMPPSTSVTIYKNKRDYVYNLIFNTIPAPGMTSANEPSITGKDRRNIPSLYEYTKNMTCGTFDLLKIFPNGGTSGTNPKLFEEQIRNEQVILRFVNDEKRHPNIIRLRDWNVPGTSIVPKSTSFNLVEKQQQISGSSGAAGEEADKMNYFILEFMDDFLGNFYLKTILPTYLKTIFPTFEIDDSTAGGEGRLLVDNDDDTRILTILRDILSAIKSLHDRDMIHRDLNINKFMVKCSGVHVITKLVDLSSVVVLPSSKDFASYVDQISGLKSHMEEGVRFPHYHLPTDPDYAAPEVHHMKPSAFSSSSSLEQFTPATDCWSLGIIFKALCTGNLELKASDWKEVPQGEWNQRNEEALQSLPDNLKLMIKGLLELNPLHRLNLHKAQHLLFETL